MYFDDPEQEKEDWEEFILANNQVDAGRRCQRKAEHYTKEGQSNVELVNVRKVSKKATKAFYCKFRS